MGQKARHHLQDGMALGQRGQNARAVRNHPSGTILVHEPEAPKAGIVALYARVSSSDEQADLERDVVRLLVFANAQGLSVGTTVKEVGSGLNGRRKELIKLLSDPNVTTIVVEHRDRLTRFGF
ncbi:recombinase family protein, partial [Hydrogenibacillus schlegelii]|uniref:recombinase family protein n=1 Tax=Hydrogenibacillus schlegelii TaxID=1484 RepID=UPI0034A013D4